MKPRLNVDLSSERMEVLCPVCEQPRRGRRAVAAQLERERQDLALRAVAPEPVAERVRAFARASGMTLRQATDFYLTYPERFERGRL